MDLHPLALAKVADAEKNMNWVVAQSGRAADAVGCANILNTIAAAQVQATLALVVELSALREAVEALRPVAPSVTGDQR